MGGGFGGKESQSALFACVAAVAAAPAAPVKLRLDRDDDLMVTGKRHCFWYDYEVGLTTTAACWAPRSTWSRAPVTRPTCPAR
jgi:xanthine dehydrogenase molybdopterin-binding subunit B